MAKRLLFTAIVAGVIFGIVFLAVQERLFIKEEYERPAPEGGFGDIDGDGVVKIYGFDNDAFLAYNYFSPNITADTNMNGIMDEGDIMDVDVDGDGDADTTDKKIIKALLWCSETKFCQMVNYYKTSLAYFFMHVPRYSTMDEAPEGTWFTVGASGILFYKITYNNALYRIQISVEIPSGKAMDVYFFKNGTGTPWMPYPPANDALEDMNIPPLYESNVIPEAKTDERIQFLNRLPGVLIPFNTTEVKRRIEVDGDRELTYHDTELIRDYARGIVDTLPVWEGYTNTPPHADFTWTPQYPKVGETVVLDASASYDEDGFVVEYKWRFFDKSIGTYRTITRNEPVLTTALITNEAGDVDVTLTVKDNGGAVDSITKTITVVMPYEVPHPSFTWTPENPKVGEEVTFDASASTGDIWAFRWDFGDGTYTNYVFEPIIKHTYYEAGTYTVRLEAYGYTTNQTTQPVSISKQITVTLEEEKYYTLTVMVEPPEGGNVAVEPYMESYPEGTEVTLTALPNEGYAFSRWVVDGVESSASQLTITMDSDKTVHAYFVKVRENQYVLEVAVEPPEGGMVVVVPSGGIYDAGTTVYLTAVPSEGYRFSHWEGDVTGGEMLKTVVMDSNKTVVAHFEKIKMIPGFEIPVLMLAILLFAVRRRKNETAKLL